MSGLTAKVIQIGRMVDAECFDSYVTAQKLIKGDLGLFSGILLTMLLVALALTVIMFILAIKMAYQYKGIQLTKRYFVMHHKFKDMDPIAIKKYEELKA